MNHPPSTAASHDAPLATSANGGVPLGSHPIGTYLVHLGYAMPVDQKDLTAGLESIGFSRLRFVDKTPSEATFLGALTRSVRLVNTALLTWRNVSKVAVDVDAPVPDLSRARVTPYDLTPGAVYEMRAVSRLKLHPNAKEVEAALRTMGFLPSAVVLLGTDRERQRGISTSVAVWYARGVWQKPRSCVTTDDDFYFEQLLALEPTPTR